MTLMDILEGPSQAILNGPAFEKTVLVAVDQIQDDLLQTICQEFGDQLEAIVQ